MTEFASKLKELREKKGMSQKDLAGLLNVSRSTIGNYEQGTRIPTIDMVETFCDVLNVEPNDLFNFEIKKAAVSSKLNHDFIKTLCSLNDDEMNLVKEYVEWLLANRPV